MPATPRFKVSQTDDVVIVSIKVPHVRVGSAETHVDGREFSFYCKPYLLRLTLPLEIGGEEDGSCKAVYDPNDDNGTITATLIKATPGVHFPDLDLTTTLLQPRWTPADLVREDRPGGDDKDGAPASSGVEVISSEHYDVPDSGVVDGSVTAGKKRGETPPDSAPTAPGVEGGAADGGEKGGDEEGDGARGEAGNAGDDGGRGAGAVLGVEGPEIMIRPPTYGFNDKFSGFFTSLRDELREMIHLADPDNTPRSKRRELRLKHEKATFDADRYLGDLFTEEEDPLLTEALAFEPHWKSCRWPAPRGGRSDSRSPPVGGGRSDSPPPPPVSGGAAVSSEKQKSDTDGGSGMPTECQDKSENETDGVGGGGGSSSSSGLPTGCQDPRRREKEEEEEGMEEVLQPCAPAPVCETPTPTSLPAPPPPPPKTSDAAALVSAAQPAAASAPEGEGGSPPKEILAGPGCGGSSGGGGGGGDSIAVESATVSAGGDDGGGGGHTEGGKGGARRDTGTATGAGTGAATSAGENSKEGLSSAVVGEEEEARQGGGGGEGAHVKDGAFEGFTEGEEEQMRRLPNREYLIPAGGAEEKRALLGLADILFAYAYDHRTTGGDATVESAWTVAVLSPLLTWLETPEGDVDEACVALAGIRRSLIFPYLRVWQLGALVAKDVGDILRAGKRCILRCLLQTYAVLERGEVHYFLNKLFIEDYCVWIQKASEASLAAFAERYAVAAASTTKSGVHLDLERIEAEAVGAADKKISEEISEKSSEESSEDGSEESSSEDDSSSSGEEESSSEEGEEEEEAEKKEEEQEKNRQGEADEKSTSTLHTKGAVDGGEGSITDELAVSTENVPVVAVGALGQDRVEGTTGSGSTSSTSCSVTTGPRVERSSDLLHLESRVDDGAGRAASVVTDRLSSLSLEKQPRGPLDSVVRAKGEGQKSDASGRSESGGVGVGAGEGRRKKLIQEL